MTFFDDPDVPGAGHSPLAPDARDESGLPTDDLSDHVWAQLVAEIGNFRQSIRSLPTTQPAPPEQVRAEVEQRFDFQHSRALSELLPEVAELLQRYTVHVVHPRNFGLFNPSVREAGIVGETLSAAYNLQLAVWSNAPAAAEIERTTLRTLAAVLGLNPDRILANFTTGGAEANLSAVLAALADRFPETGAAGLAALAERGARPVVYVSSESHHSFVKIARMTGLGTDALRVVPASAHFTADVPALRRQIEQDRAAGYLPFMIVGTAGTTATGAVDPLSELADVAADYHAWYHVDAAWGGGAAFVPRLRPLLGGIERADSVTWDAHKWMSVPMGAGMFFCSHPEAVRRAFTVSASYMPPAPSLGAAVDEPFLTTVQWSRRAIGLKVFLSLAELGIGGYAELVEHQTRIGTLLRSRLAASGWTVTNDTILPVVTFTDDGIRAGRYTPRAVLDEVYARGRVWISEVEPAGHERMLRACVTSYLTGEADVEVLITELSSIRQTLMN